MAPSNMSIQTDTEPSYMDRPSMKQEDHPAHNMPDATEPYNGEQPKSTEGRQMLEDKKNYGKNNY